MILCKSVSDNKYEKIWEEWRQQRLQKEEQRIKHDLLLNNGKLTSKCEMWHRYTGWISGSKWLHCMQRTTRRGLRFTVHVPKHIGASTHRERWSARGLPTESHNWQTLQRWQQTRSWQLWKWVVLWAWEILKTDFTVGYVKYIPPCHIIIKSTVFHEAFIIHHQHKQFVTFTIIYILRSKAITIHIPTITL